MSPRVAVAQWTRPAILVFFHNVENGPVEFLLVQALVDLVDLGNFHHAADSKVLQKCAIVVLSTSFSGHEFGVWPAPFDRFVLGQGQIILLSGHLTFVACELVLY